MTAMLQPHGRGQPLPVPTVTRPKKDTFLSIYRWNKEDSMKSLIGFIMKEADKRGLLKGKTGRRRIEDHLNVLLSNLFYAHERNTALAINLNEKFYQADKTYGCYNPAKVGYVRLRTALNIIDSLFTLEKTAPKWFPSKTKAKAKDGKPAKSNPDNRVTTIRLARPTAERLLDDYGIDLMMINSHPNRLLVELRHPRSSKLTGLKRKIPYGRPPKAMNSVLIRYNEVLAATAIKLELPDLPPKCIPSGTVIKVFSGTLKQGGALKLGGRFYGPWQNMRSRDRPFITLDGCSTVELDYKALHACFLYHMLGLELDTDADDPYVLRNYDHRGEPEKLRKLVKVAFLIGFNCKNFRDWRGAVRKEIADTSNADNFPSYAKTIPLKEFLSAIKASHPAIDQYFHSGLGICLQYTDSRIAERIIQTFCNLNKPILCYHDGFRVKEEDEELLLDLMIESYKAIRSVTSSPVISKK